MELDLFKEWLMKNKGLKKKSAGDVVSRLRRVTKLIDLDIQAPYEKIIVGLENNEEFSKFSLFVKPQLKHSIRLYKDFIQENLNNLQLDAYASREKTWTNNNR